NRPSSIREPVVQAVHNNAWVAEIMHYRHPRAIRINAEELGLGITGFHPKKNIVNVPAGNLLPHPRQTRLSRVGVIIPVRNKSEKNARVPALLIHSDHLASADGGAIQISVATFG